MDRVIVLFALLLGGGAVGLLGFVDPRRVDAAFFRLAGWLGGLSLALALFLMLRSPAGGPMQASVWLIGAPLLLGIGHGAAMSRREHRTARALALPLSAAAIVAVAVAGPILPLVAPSAAVATDARLASLGLVAGAGLLGSVLLSMLLGHSYLSTPGLPIFHLRRLTRLAAGFVVARLVLFAVAAPALLNAGAAGPVIVSGRLDAVAVLASDLPLVSIRFVLGILIPGVLAWMIDRTVRIRSTQSATGLLYVALVFVLFGELIASYLFVTTAVAT